jgi:pimeloyl-ACP methyl ester carboxylesterase
MKADPDTAMVALLDAFAQDYRASLARLPVPALLRYGAASTSTTPHVREFMASTIPDATLVVFEESSHCLMLEESERFDRAVDEFARRL